MNNDRIIEINIENEMKTSYIDYSMSVIVSRALPDVRDGFKPVHRRVLFGMEKLGNFSNAPYKKSARIVGDVLGKYHPHGDSSVYLAMVRLAQDWAMRYPLVDGQGNFGSVDGDSPAAMRYTEARLGKMGEEMMRDMDKDTVNFVPNFDNTLDEPEVLPTRFPNLLVNGGSGIAVGMATNMAPHNLTESINACLAMLENPDIDTDGLMKYIIAPDFPTGGIIHGYQGVRDAFETGKGRIVIRSKAEIETEHGHDRIVVTEIPYNVNKRELIENIAGLVEDKRIDGISNINDESDRHGMRIVIDVKKDFNANVLLNKLYKMTELQSSFSVNNVCLVKGRPQTVTLRDMLYYFLEHRHEVVIRRTEFELKKAKERAHILEGLIIASDNIDEVIHIIRSSKTTDEARQRLGERFNLDDIQTRAIVEMRLRQLTNLEQDKLHAEMEELLKTIAHLEEILTNPDVCRKVIEDELIEVRDKFGDERRTQIEYSAEEMNAEDFYPDDPMIITISHFGYIKRTPLSEYRTQNRGGVGAKGSATRDEDFIEYIYEATNHNYMLFFTALGRCYWLRVFEIPEGAKNSKGRAIQNVLNIGPENRIYAFIRATKLKDPEYNQNHYIVFGTKNGVVKRTRLSEFSRPRVNGVNALNIRDNDQLIGAVLTEGDSEIVLANRNGRAIRFSETKVRPMGRTATGVKGMTLDGGNDAVVGMICMRSTAQDDVLVLSEQGMGKRSKLDDYRVTNRGAKGVKTINITEKTGKLIAIRNVNDSNDIVIINKSGITIRLKVADLRVQGRNTQGVRLINLEKKNDEIASVCKVDTDPEKIEEYIPEGEGLQQDIMFDDSTRAAEKNDEQLNENGDSQSYDQEGTLPFNEIDK
ncbi:MAG: DNA gyrase subunit A [Muribaculaceae bacterium]|nr:DNA gyrase subunit A [Muribaculaceae bacterium]